MTTKWSVCSAYIMSKILRMSQVDSKAERRDNLNAPTSTTALKIHLKQAYENPAALFLFKCALLTRMSWLEMRNMGCFSELNRNQADLSFYSTLPPFLHMASHKWILLRKHVLFKNTHQSMKKNVITWECPFTQKHKANAKDGFVRNEITFLFPEGRHLF